MLNTQSIIQAVVKAQTKEVVEWQTRMVHSMWIAGNLTSKQVVAFNKAKKETLARITNK